ncbi:MAG: hypothetical protein ACLFP4_05805 [Spirochaetales bacterium]
MIEFFRSLPQGVSWYPLTLVLVFMLGRLALRITKGSRPRRGRVRKRVRRSRYADTIAFAKSDGQTREELERLCIGLLLEANGYGPYSVDRCRLLMENAAGTELELALAYHLGDRSDPPSPQEPVPPSARALPPVCQIAVQEVQKRTEE